MAGQKLSAKATEAVEFLDYLVRQFDLLASQIEDYATTRKPATADWIRGQIARELTHLRQRAMAKNVGILADEIGRLAIQASTGGSQQMKSRVLREGIASLQGSVARRRKSTMDTDLATAAKAAVAAVDAKGPGAGSGPAE
jgi:hypothetical protein